MVDGAIENCSAVRSVHLRPFDEQVRRASRRITVRRRWLLSEVRWSRPGCWSGWGPGRVVRPAGLGWRARPDAGPAHFAGPRVLSEPRGVQGADRELVTELTGRCRRPHAGGRGSPTETGRPPWCWGGAASGKLTVLVGPADQLPADWPPTPPGGRDPAGGPADGSGQLVVDSAGRSVPGAPRGAAGGGRRAVGRSLLSSARSLVEIDARHDGGQYTQGERRRQARWLLQRSCCPKAGSTQCGTGQAEKLAGFTTYYFSSLTG